MGHFRRIARFNFGVFVFGSLFFGAAHSLILVFQNHLPSYQFLNLILFLTDQILTGFLMTGAALALLLTLCFAAGRGRVINYPLLLVTETLFVSVLIALLIVLKKYFSDALPPGLTYFAFYTSHWVKENLLLVGSMVLSLLGLSGWWLTKKIEGYRWFGWNLVVISLFFLTAVKATAFAVNTAQQQKLSKEDAPNIILLTIDTLRADHLTSYGYPRNTSPFLSQLASESAVLMQAEAAWPKTNQSFASLMSGKYCYATGIGVQLASFLPRQNLLLAEVFKNKGYRTAAIVSNANLSRYFNFADGFDEYYELWRKQKGPARERGWDDARSVTTKAIQWLQDHHDEKFFLWVHYIDPHTPYTPPAPYRELFQDDFFSRRFDPLPLEAIKKTSRLEDHRDPDHYIAQYDGEIAYNDEQIRLFLDQLEERGQRENTLLVFTSDHGESLTENEFYFDHGRYAYENCTHVPLMFRFPRRIQGPQKISQTVSLIDIYPTLLDLTKTPVSPKVQGHSLKNILTGEGTDSLPESVFMEAGNLTAYQRAVRTNDWKLIETTDLTGGQNSKNARYELYHLSQDPAEKINLAGQNEPKEIELMRLLASWGGRRPQALNFGPSPNKTSEIDPETLEQLKSLGYVN